MRLVQKTSAPGGIAQTTGIPFMLAAPVPATPVEDLEDEYDLEAARRADLQASREGRAPIPWAEARKHLDS